MNTCSNCGATLRPGARFCTICGTRLNESQPARPAGWGSPQADSSNETQQTSVIRPVQPQDTPLASDPQQSSANTWSNAYSGSPASDRDPASRFRSALDNDVQPVEDTASSPAPDPEATWGSPAPVFTPPPPSNWNYSANDQTAAEPEPAEEPAPESSWGTWSGNEDIDQKNDKGTTPAQEPVDNSDEKLDSIEDADDSLSPSDARDKAIALADELRRTIRMMGSGGESDHGAAVMALTEASLYVGDFSDVRGALADVKNDPRDIEALGNLAGKVARIDALLDEHKSLANAVETAIRELNG